jgi:hypothetical protein
MMRGFVTVNIGVQHCTALPPDVRNGSAFPSSNGFPRCAALPPDVRNGSAFPSSNGFSLGLRPFVGLGKNKRGSTEAVVRTKERAQPGKKVSSPERSQTFRTSGGGAAKPSPKDLQEESFVVTSQLRFVFIV